MKFRMLMLGSSFVAMSAVSVLGSLPAAAQDASANVEAVTVTGSRISIQGYEAPTPVTVIGAEQLAREDQRVLEAASALGVRRHRQAERLELLRVPAGAQARNHALSPVERGKLREVAQDPGRMHNPAVGHDCAQLQAVRPSR